MVSRAFGVEAFSKDNAAAKTILKYMSTSTFGADDAKLGGYISPHKDFDLNNYPSQFIKSVAQIAYNANSTDVSAQVLQLVLPAVEIDVEEDGSPGPFTGGQSGQPAHLGERSIAAAQLKHVAR